MMTTCAHTRVRPNIVQTIRPMIASLASISTVTQHKPAGSARPFRLNRFLLLASTILLAAFTPSLRASAQTSSAANLPVIVADFNHDGLPDALVLSITSPTATLAFGSVPFGTFGGNTRAVTFPAACASLYIGQNGVSPVSVGDFNGDGFPDLLFRCRDASGPSADTVVGVMIGKGDGTFAPAITLPAAFATESVVGDFNHDGKLDIVLIGPPAGAYSYGILFFAGKGDGTFAAPVTTAFGTSSTFSANFVIESVGVADMNGDGYLDLVTENIFTATSDPTGAPRNVSIFGNNRDGTFGLVTQGSSLPNSVTVVGNNPTVNAFNVMFGNVYASGLPDVLLPNVGNSPGVFLLKNTSTTTAYSLSATPANLSFPNLVDARVGNFTGSVFSDLAITDGSGVTILSNNGSGSFTAVYSTLKTTFASTSNTVSDQFAVADANGDGFADLYTASGSGNSVSVAVNLVSGTATATSQPFTLPIGTSQIAASWPGNLNYLGSSVTTTQTVLPTPTAVTLTSNLNPARTGAAVTFTALVASLAPTSTTPTGTIVFTDGSSTLGTATLDSTGTATITTSTLSAAVHTIQAAYSGDSFFATSAGTATQTVVLSPTAVTLTSSLNPALAGTSIIFTAIAAPSTPTSLIPTGTIVFTDGASSLGSVRLDSTGTATLSTSTLSVATHVIQAAYSGDTSFAASTSSISQSINQPGQLTANLLLNPGAELGLVNGVIPYWTPSGQGNPTLDSGAFNLGINPHTGTYDFVGYTGPSDILSQNVYLLATSLTPTMLDSGTLRAAISFWEQGLNQGTPSDDAYVSLTFLDANGATLSSVSTPEVDSHNNAWQNYTNTFPIPAGTRSITYTMNFVRHAGSDLDGYVDDNSLVILAGPPAAAKPTLNWTPPAAIPYGTPLSSTQLTAAATYATGASIPGVFTYTPAAGAILPVGLNTLSVLFTPTDLTAFTTATATVPLTILQATPTIALAITSGTTAAATAPQGTVITLTATALSGTTPITPGQINFCDAAATTCTDIHLLGTAQLNSTGTATLKFIPAIGTHTYKAVFLGTQAALATASSASTLTVTGQYATSTNLTQSGTPGNYTLTAAVTANGSVAPTGVVSFLDSTNATTTLGTAALASASSLLGFSSPAFVPTGSVPLGVKPIDLNNDGKLDLLVNNSSSNTLSVLLGNGDGTFTPATSQTTGRYPSSVAVGDFNNDGKPDVALTDYFDGQLTILLGNGDGTFTPATQPTTGNDSRTVVTADFNQDGNLDLAVGRDNSLVILLGNGDGTFTAAATNPATGNGPNYGLGTGDFNGDGKPDIAVTNSGDSTLSILLGNGDGTFTPAASPATGSFPVNIAVADLNRDGKLDLAVSNALANTVTILLGNGNGTFTAAASPTTDASPQAVTAGDLNGDGVPDLAVTNETGKTVTILLGNGDGTFTVSTPLLPGTGPDRAAIADLNGDGIADLITNDASAGGISIFLGQITTTSTATSTNISPTGTGTHQTIASYPGDLLHAPSTSTPIPLTAQPLATNITWTPATPTVPYGTPLGPQQLNATAISITGAPIAGVFTYTPAAGTILTAGRQTIQLIFTPTSSIYTAITTTQTINITQATPTLAWPTPAPIAAGIPLSATQLNASATGISGAALPGTFTYTPAAGALPPVGTQTLSVTFTPTDITDYTAATRTVPLQVIGLTLTSLTPSAASIGDPARTITLTGTGFTTAVLTQVNGARLATTFVNPTTLTALVPAANFATVGTLQIALVNPATSTVTAALPLTVTAPAPAVTLTGPTTTAPGTQPALALTITNPYPVPLTATFSLTFTSAVTPIVDDPSIQFAAGGRTFTFIVPANSTAVPAIQLQAGTVAGTITIPLTLTAAGVTVTPTAVQPVIITVPAAIPTVSTASITRTGAQLTVTIHGFSNTREVSTAAFHFLPAIGASIDTPDVTVPVTPIFSGWFSSTPSVQYGSAFTYTQIFTVSDTAASIGSIQVTLTNAAGISTLYTAQ